MSQTAISPDPRDPGSAFDRFDKAMCGLVSRRIVFRDGGVITQSRASEREDLFLYRIRQMGEMDKRFIEELLKRLIGDDDEDNP